MVSEINFNKELNQLEIYNFNEFIVNTSATVKAEVSSLPYIEFLNNKFGENEFHECKEYLLRLKKLS